MRNQRVYIDNGRLICNLKVLCGIGSATIKKTMETVNGILKEKNIDGHVANLRLSG